MGSEVVVALKLIADLAGGKVAGGLLGRFADWRRRRRLNKLLARPDYTELAGLKPVTDGLLGAGELEIHTFRVTCTAARGTSSFVNGQDPVHLDGAMISQVVGIDVSELERVLVMLQARACLSVERAPIVDGRTLNGVTIRVPRSAVELVHKLSEDASTVVT